MSSYQATIFDSYEDLLLRQQRAIGFEKYFSEYLERAEYGVAAEYAADIIASLYEYGYPLLLSEGTPYCSPVVGLGLVLDQDEGDGSVSLWVQDIHMLDDLEVEARAQIEVAIAFALHGRALESKRLPCTVELPQAASLSGDQYTTMVNLGYRAVDGCWRLVVRKSAEIVAFTPRRRRVSKG